MRGRHACFLTAALYSVAACDSAPAASNDAGSDATVSDGGADALADVGGDTTADARAARPWTAVIDGNPYTEARRITIDSEGNTILAGVFARTIRSGTNMVTAVGATDVFVASYSPSGVPRFLVSFGTPGEDTVDAIDATDVIAVNLHGSGVAPEIGDLGANGSALVLLDAATGSRIAHRVASGVRWEDVSLGGSSLIACGTFTGTTMFGTTSVTSHGSTDLFVAKLDRTLDATDVHTAGGVAGDSLSECATGADGNTYVVATFLSATDFGGGSRPVPGDFGFVLLSLDADLGYRWDVVWSTALRTGDFSMDEMSIGPRGPVIGGRTTSAIEIGSPTRIAPGAFVIYVDGTNGSAIFSRSSSLPPATEVFTTVAATGIHVLSAFDRDVVWSGVRSRPGLIDAVYDFDGALVGTPTLVAEARSGDVHARGATVVVGGSAVQGIRILDRVTTIAGDVSGFVGSLSL